MRKKRSFVTEAMLIAGSSFDYIDLSLVLSFIKVLSEVVRK